jgi:hypothetical protein
VALELIQDLTMPHSEAWQFVHEALTELWQASYI